MSPTTRTRTITSLVQNESGTLNRLVSMFRRRGFSLNSLNAGDCERPGYSRVTFVIDADDGTLGQVLNQVERLIEVVEVEDITDETSVTRELVLVHLFGSDIELNRAGLECIAKGGKILTFEQGAATMELSGEPDEIEEFVANISPQLQRTVHRTGAIALHTNPWR